MISENVYPGLPAAILQVPANKPLPVMAIVEVVFGHFNMAPNLYKSTSRKVAIAWPRSIAIYFICRHHSLTVKAVGSLFDLHHSTVIYHRDNISGLIEVDKITAKVIALIDEKLKRRP